MKTVFTIKMDRKKIAREFQGGICWGNAKMTYWLLKFVYLASKLRHSLVVHPVLGKILNPPLSFIIVTLLKLMIS